MRERCFGSDPDDRDDHELRAHPEMDSDDDGERGHAIGRCAADTSTEETWLDTHCIKNPLFCRNGRRRGPNLGRALQEK